MTKPILGIDASKWQGETGMPVSRFKALDDAGVRFGMFRASIGTVPDQSAPTNLERADKLGWVVGTYHFLVGGHGEQQANLYASVCGGGLATLDVEQSGVNAQTVKDFVNRFRELRPGKPLGCYTSEGAWHNLVPHLDGAALFDYLWQARWTQLGTNERKDLPDQPPAAGFGGWDTADLWQFGAFHVNGYPPIDGDAWYGTPDALRALGQKPRPALVDRVNYRKGYNAVLDAATAAITATRPATGNPVLAKGTAAGQEAAAAALDALRLDAPQ